ncbi:hypothetical protein ABMA27_007643 [Loxostege sticticalis]|uniref:Uncharacterized protein n=1 Tax=Loxostege sticticalis TaxID=481309 RepID=A0ABR3HG59_LOXSC
MEWWCYAPILMAIIMFLLVGTICERRIETAIRRILERRRALLRPLTPPVEYDDMACSTTDLPLSRTPSLMITPSKQTLGDFKRELVADNRHEVPIEHRKLVFDVAC